MQNRRSWKELTTPSAGSSLTEAKAHLRVTHTDDDTLIGVYLDAATQMVEARTGRALVTRSFLLSLDEFPDCEEIELPVAPTTAVTYLKYIATDGTLTTWSSSNYDVDTTALLGRVVKKYTSVWPTTYPGVPNAVQVTFVAGYANAASVPSALRAAILYMVAQMYENRTPVETGVTVASVPMTFNFALDTYKIFQV